MSASWALQISHSGRPFFHSTHAAPGSSPQKMSDMPTVEARPRRSTTRPKRIVMLCATYLFYCDPQASFPLFFAADRVSLHRKRQVSRKRPIQTSNEYQPIADARNCELLRVRRPHSIEQAFCQAQSEAAQRNPPESREEQLQSLVRNREPGHHHSPEHTCREAHSHPGGQRGYPYFHIQHLCFSFPSRSRWVICRPQPNRIIE